VQTHISAEVSVAYTTLAWPSMAQHSTAGNYICSL